MLHSKCFFIGSGSRQNSQWCGWCFLRCVKAFRIDVLQRGQVKDFLKVFFTWCSIKCFPIWLTLSFLHLHQTQVLKPSNFSRYFSFFSFSLSIFERSQIHTDDIMKNCFLNVQMLSVFEAASKALKIFWIEMCSFSLMGTNLNKRTLAQSSQYSRLMPHMSISLQRQIRFSLSQKSETIPFWKRVSSVG